MGSSAESGLTLPSHAHVLADTNVVLDLLIGREPFATAAKPLWDAHSAGRVEVYISASALTDIFYICRKQIGADRARVAVGECLRRFVVLTVDRAVLEAALQIVGPDFEDDVQVAIARASSLHAIVTRDVAGFTHESIPVLLPIDVVPRLMP